MSETRSIVPNNRRGTDAKLLPSPTCHCLGMMMLQSGWRATPKTQTHPRILHSTLEAFELGSIYIYMSLYVWIRQELSPSWDQTFQIFIAATSEIEHEGYGVCFAGVTLADCQELLSSSNCYFKSRLLWHFSIH